MCWILLGGVLYCDTTYQATFQGRSTLTGLYISTFYNDVKNQLAGLLSVTPSGSLSGDVTASEWTQCLFVPPLVIYLLWWLWPKLRDAPVRGRAAGYGILGTGLLLYIIGYMAENYYIGVISMEVVYAGLIVLFLGWEIMRIVIFPWAFLLFMWPYGFFEDLAFQLRLLMSSASHYTLLLIQVPNTLNGSSILSPPGSTMPFAVDIADPCSGIRSLFALVMIASLYAFLSFEKPWQKVVIIVASVPLVIFGNLIRIIALALGTIHFGSAFALGTNDHPSWFHEGAGYMVYAINVLSLIGLGWVLTRLSRGEKKVAS